VDLGESWEVEVEAGRALASEDAVRLVVGGP
jgi:hypothetical protein